MLSTAGAEEIIYVNDIHRVVRVVVCPLFTRHLLTQYRTRTMGARLRSAEWVKSSVSATFGFRCKGSQMNILTRRQFLGLVCISLFGVGATPTLAVELVRDHGSEFVICHDEAAPLSDVMAASELQAYLKKVSGAELSIVHEPQSPMICLGDNAASCNRRTHNRFNG